MQKTTVYLPDHLKTALRETARSLGRSEAELLREAVESITRKYAAPEPRLPMFFSGDPGWARRVADDPERELEGFGEA